MQINTKKVFISGVILFFIATGAYAAPAVAKIACFQLGDNAENVIKTAKENNLVIDYKSKNKKGKVNYFLKNNNKYFYVSDVPTQVSMDFYKNQLYNVLIDIKPKDRKTGDDIFNKLKSIFVKEYKAVKEKSDDLIYTGKANNIDYLLIYRPKRNNGITVTASDIQIADNVNTEKANNTSKDFPAFKFDMNSETAVKIAKENNLILKKDGKLRKENGITKKMMVYTGKDSFFNSNADLNITLGFKNDLLYNIVIIFKDITGTENQQLFDSLENNLSQKCDFKAVQNKSHEKILEGKNCTLIKNKNEIISIFTK